MNIEKKQEQAGSSESDALKCGNVFGLTVSVSRLDASVTRGRVCVCSPVSGHVIAEPDQLITHSADVSFSVAKNRLKQKQDSRVFLLSPWLKVRAG